MTYDIALLRLLQLTDSALPIGALAHSFGIETLVSSELVAAKDVPAFLGGFVEESGVMQAVFCRAGFRAARKFSNRQWVELNDRLSALQPGRECRAADGVLGRRLLLMVTNLGHFSLLEDALDAAERGATYVHYAPAFGLAAAALGIEEDPVVLAYLHHSITAVISVFQRLLPIGQNQAMGLLWRLKPAILEAAEASRIYGLENVACFTPLLDWGTMEHPALTTRLFIS
jgi:urease accessory protein